MKRLPGDGWKKKGYHQEFWWFFILDDSNTTNLSRYSYKNFKSMRVGISNDEFNEQIDCTYREEQYSTRDNGAVLRYSRDGKTLRPNDNKWAFVNPNSTNGYMEISSFSIPSEIDLVLAKDLDLL